MRPLILFTTFLLVTSQPLAAQSRQQPPGESSPPAIRRWVDVQQLQLSSRFRWIAGTDGTIDVRSLQWQPQVRARLLFDADARYSLNVNAGSGRSIVSGWNNTGWGFGEFSGTFNVKQLFLQARPGDAVELQVGGLNMVRGQSTATTTYDSDVYMVGERIILRPSGPVEQISVTTGYLGDVLEPNVFTRVDRLGDWNYAQVLVGGRLHPRVRLSAEYTYEDAKDILRQAIIVHVPAAAGLSLLFEAYERVAPDSAQGFNLLAEAEPHARLELGLGVASIDRDYGHLNSDRFDDGTRVYGTASLALSEDVALSLFAGKVFATNYPVENDHRVDVVLTFNPTARLKRARVF